MRIAVVMDPLETVRIEHDTTYVLMREAHRRGHEVFHVAPAGVGSLGGGATLNGRRVGLTDDPDRPFTVERFEQREGGDFDVVLIRTDPPFDADYLAVTQLLDLLPPRVFVMKPALGPAGRQRETGRSSLPGSRAKDLGGSGHPGPGDVSRIRRRVGGGQAARWLRRLGGFVGPRWRSELSRLAQGRHEGRHGQVAGAGGCRGGPSGAIGGSSS